MGLVYLSIGTALVTLLFAILTYKLGNFAKSLSIISANVFALAILKTALFVSDYDSEVSFHVGVSVIFII